MDETHNTQRDPLPEKGPAFGGKEGSTSSNPRTYSEEEYDKAVKEAGLKAYSDFLAESGRKHKPVEEENKTLKAQISSHHEAMQEKEREIATLKAEIDDLSADDPDKKQLIASLRKLKDDERNHLKAVKQLESERQTLAKDKMDFYAERLAAEHGIEKEMLVQMTGGEVERMKMLAPYLAGKAKSSEKTSEDKADTFIPDSGVTRGGSSDYSRMKPEEKFRLGIEAERKRK